jgi:hypothetical protein
MRLEQSAKVKSRTTGALHGVARARVGTRASAWWCSGQGSKGGRRRDDRGKAAANTSNRGKAAVHTSMVWGPVAPGLGCLPAALQKECKFERNTKSYGN